MRQQRSHCMTLMMRRDEPRQLHETRQGNRITVLGHNEEVAKQIRLFISYTWRADHKCDSDRRVALTFTQRTVNVEEHTSFFKWRSKDDRGEVGKFAEWSWFRSIAKTSKLGEQLTDVQLVGKLNRAIDQLLVIKSLTRSAAGAGRKQVRDEKWILGSVNAVLSRIPRSKVSTDIDTSVARQEYITNQALDEHGCTTRYTRSDGDTEAHCRTRGESIWIKEFA